MTDDKCENCTCGESEDEDNRAEYTGDETYEHYIQATMIDGTSWDVRIDKDFDTEDLQEIYYALESGDTFVMIESIIVRTADVQSVVWVK